jgi:hypothetical protein
MSLASRVELSDQVVFRALQNEGLLLDLRTGTYFGLDSTGSEIVRLLEEDLSLPEIADYLLSKFDVNRARCETDLLQFVELLLSKDFVRIRG